MSNSEMVPVPFQVFEENLGSLPIIRPLSSLPGGTSVDAERDVQLFLSGRQLKSIIAPPMTSSEGPTVIHLAGKAGARSSEGYTNRKNE